MWLLEHDTLFQGKRLWLRPGAQYMFGRTSAKNGKGGVSDGRQIFIENKSVSRKHTMIRVLEVEDTDGTKLHMRPGLEITDLSCRQGTVIDGGKLQPGGHMLQTPKVDGARGEYEKVVVSGTEHTISLTASFPPLRIKWHPVVLTFASKDGKEYTSRIHALGIKTSSDFVHAYTTHVVSGKRNLPRVLQGLLTAKHIVTPAYLDAVLAVARPQNTDPNNFLGAKLEEDFDAHWPKEEDHITPPGKEPVRRPLKWLMPQPERAELFAGLTFIFLRQSQFDSLQDVVTSGGGKAFVFAVEPGVTTVKEYVDFARNAVGHKKRGTTHGDRIPVVTVRLTTWPEGMERWEYEFKLGIEEALGQRCIQQNEFLDAILQTNTSSLQQPPTARNIQTNTQPMDTEEPASQAVGRTTRSDTAPQGPASEPASAQPDVPAKEEEPKKLIPRKRPARRTQSRFTGFDDYEPPTKVARIEESAMEDIQETAPTQAFTKPFIEPSQSQAPAASPSTHRFRPTRSQAIETVEPLSEEQLLPAFAEIKKRRAATRAATRGVSASAEPQEAASQRAAEPKTQSKGAQVYEHLQKLKKKVGTKEVDVLGQARLRLKEEEDKRKADEESLREALEGVDISAIKDLVQVEVMEVRPRQKKTTGTGAQGQGTKEGWKDEWNGRKNFKKFVRRGAERRLQPQKVIVALEEVPRKSSFAIDEPYFLDEGEVKAKVDRQRQERRRKKGAESESEAEGGFVRRKRTGSREVINVEDSDEEVEQPSMLASRSRTQRVAETQLEGARSQSQRKRVPLGAAEGERPRKKRATPVGVSDSDAEETGFRFRRKR